MIDAEEKQVVADLVKSGEYFREASEWYDSKYHAPMAERSLMILITLVSVGIIFFATRAVIGLLPLSEVEYISFLQPDAAEKIPAVINLTTSFKATDRALMSYHVQDYVYHRERYNIQNVEKQYLRVKALSSPQVFEEYTRYIDPRNPESPIARYERHTRRTIAINAIAFSDSTGRLEDDPQYTPDRAAVNFTATMTSLDGAVKRETWQADVSFTYEKIVVDQETYEVTPMKFMITGYKVRQLLGYSTP